MGRVARVRGADGSLRPRRGRGRPDATVEATRNLWFHTGDLGRLDDEGYLYFVDRKKDALRRRGENISSFEMEAVLLAHDAVSDAAVHAFGLGGQSNGLSRPR